MPKIVYLLPLSKSREVQEKAERYIKRHAKPVKEDPLDPAIAAAFRQYGIPDEQHRRRYMWFQCLSSHWKEAAEIVLLIHGYYKELTWEQTLRALRASKNAKPTDRQFRKWE